MTDPEPFEPDEPAQAEPEGDGAAMVDDVETMAAVLDLDRQDILLLKNLPDAVDKMRDMTTEGESVRVRFAANRALVAIAERVARICRRDLMADKG